MKFNKYLKEKNDSPDWDPFVKTIAKKMRENFNTHGSSGFYMSYNRGDKQFNLLTYYQNTGSLDRRNNNATTDFIIPEDSTTRDLELAMKKMLKDPKIMKAKKEFSSMAQGQADYYSKRPMKNWPGI